MPLEDQLILDGASAISPGFSLLSQGVGNFACLHLHDLAQMRAESRQRAEQIRLDREKRGRYIDKSGKVKLRRKSRRKSDNPCPPAHSAQKPKAMEEKKLPGIETLFAVAGKYRYGCQTAYHERRDCPLSPKAMSTPCALRQLNPEGSLREDRSDHDQERQRQST